MRELERVHCQKVTLTKNALFGLGQITQFQARFGKKFWIDENPGIAFWTF